MLTVVFTVAFLFMHYKGGRGINRTLKEEQPTIEKVVENELSDLKIGYITDAHCYGKWKKDGNWQTNWRCTKPMEKFVTQMNSEFNPDIVMDGGDLSDGRDNETLKVLGIAREMMSKLDAPAYHVVGNHEARDLEKKEWLELMGYKKTYYAFDVKNYKIIVLDGNFAPTNRSSKDISSLEDINPEVDDFYPGVVTTEQINWLEKTLLEAKNKDTIVFIHQPVVERTLIKDRDSLLSNGGVLRKIFAKNNVLAVFSGHIEETCFIQEDGVTYYTLPGFHKGNKYIEDAKDKPVFFELTIERGVLEVKAYKSSDRGDNFESFVVNSETTLCNNKGIEELKQKIEKGEK